MSHPNITTVYLVGETDDGLPFIVMELVSGKLMRESPATGATRGFRPIVVLDGPWNDPALSDCSAAYLDGGGGD